MDWCASCSYAPDQKRRFHAAARDRLRKLAAEIRLCAGSYDIRSNPGGVAVSGEITLHHERFYVQVSQPATRCDTGILIRSCQGRRDYTGGANHLAPLSLLDDLTALADRVRAATPCSRHTEDSDITQRRRRRAARKGLPQPRD